MILYFTMVLLLAITIFLTYYIFTQEPTKTKVLTAIAAKVPNCVLYWLVISAVSRASTSQQYENIEVPALPAMDVIKWLEEN